MEHGGGAKRRLLEPPFFVTRLVIHLIGRDGGERAIAISYELHDKDIRVKAKR